MPSPSTSKKEANATPSTSTESKQSAPGKSKQSPSSRPLYEDYKGHFIHVAEWVLVVVRGKLNDKAHSTSTSQDKKVSRPVKENATGNLILTLARLAYWLQQTKEDQPPRAEAKYRQQDQSGVWWLIHAPAVIGRQIGLGKKATQTALNKLAELSIIEIKKRDELGLKQEEQVNYGPNARFVRIVFEKILPYVEKNMDVSRPRRQRKSK